MQLLASSQLEVVLKLKFVVGMSQNVWLNKMLRLPVWVDSLKTLIMAFSCLFLAKISDSGRPKLQGKSIISPSCRFYAQIKNAEAEIEPITTEYEKQNLEIYCNLKKAKKGCKILRKRDNNSMDQLRLRKIEIYCEMKAR